MPLPPLYSEELDIHHSNLVDVACTKPHSPLTEALRKVIFGNIQLKTLYGLSTTLSSKELHYGKLVNQRLLDVKPIKVLGSPNILDDFYYNVLAWSSTNILSVGLRKKVHSLNMVNNSLHSIADNSDISCISFDENARNMAVSNVEKQIYFVDVDQNRAHTAISLSRQVVSISWNRIIASMGRKGGKISF